MKQNKNTIIMLLCLFLILANAIYSRGQRQNLAKEIIKSNDSLITVINKYKNSIKD